MWLRERERENTNSGVIFPYLLILRIYVHFNLKTLEKSTFNLLVTLR